MKKVLLLMSFLLSLSCFSQDLKQKGDTLYYEVTSYYPTGKFFKDKDGLIYTVYCSKTKKLFIIKTSKKTGKQYRKYLKQ